MRRSLIAMAALALALLFAAQSQAAGSRQDSSVRFTEHHPDVGTGMRFAVDYMNPDDPAGKPPSVREIVLELAPKARIDTSGPARCSATDAELMASGASACRDRSVVGTGFLRLDTGVPGPGRFVDADVTFINNTRELIFLSTERQSGERVVTRSKAKRHKIISTVPPIPGGGTDGTAVDVARFHLMNAHTVVGANRHDYITTPDSCPKSGHWVNLAHYTYDDGVTQTVPTRTECRR